MKILFSIIMISTILSKPKAKVDDAFIWLEAIDDPKALTWVKKQNKTTEQELSSHPLYEEIYNETLEILNADDRIAWPKSTKEHVYNFWQDENNVRGLWRRTLKDLYIKGEPEWENLLDIDVLSNEDNVKWVYQGVNFNTPNYDKALVSLSKGGGDATVIREYDLNNKSFAKDGFFLSESKGGAIWLNKDALVIAREYGKRTLTNSGYPRQARILGRGMSMDESVLLHEIPQEYIGIFLESMKYRGVNCPVLHVLKDFYTAEYLVYYQNNLVKLDIPEESSLYNIVGEQLVFKIKSDWKQENTIYTKGSLLSTNFKSLMYGDLQVSEVVVPDERTSIEGICKYEDGMIVHKIANVKSTLGIYHFESGEWKSKSLDIPEDGTITFIDKTGADLFFSYEDFITPQTLYHLNKGVDKPQVISSLPGTFNSKNYKTVQYWATSSDGTRIPYSVTMPKNMDDKPKPTLMFAYGGFEISVQPTYIEIIGNTWLERGGVYVVANIRGGGEFGPAWHQAGLKENRQRIYDDFHAVAQDLMNNGITTPGQLGIRGRSNGGLLMGVSFTQRPDLYEAVVCGVPLLDMKRYNKLLAGASWMAEYGNPDIEEEWAYIKKYSPYHNLKKGVDYPEVFFYTSTRDDRVHPGHARKMAAKMINMGYKVYYYENLEGGHKGSSTNNQLAKQRAMEYTYLWMKLNSDKLSK